MRKRILVVSLVSLAALGCIEATAPTLPCSEVEMPDAREEGTTVLDVTICTSW